jgi:energy-coupling factor transporter ATP-binding protein EcfA2
LSEALADRLPALLSGGQRQRVALARALVVNPPLPMFDEPLSNRGARLRVEMRAEIRTLHRANGTTAIFATHDREGAFSISDRVASMHRGRILQYAAPEVLEEPPASAFVARFVGFENPIPMRGVARQGGGATAEARGVTLDLPEQRDEGGARVEEPVAVCAGRPRLTPSVRPHPPCSVGMARMARVANRSRSGQTENRRGEKVGSRIRSMPSAAARRHPARRGASRRSRLRAASTLANAWPAAQGEVFRRGGRARPHGRGHVRGSDMRVHLGDAGDNRQGGTVLDLGVGEPCPRAGVAQPADAQERRPGAWPWRPGRGLPRMVTSGAVVAGPDGIGPPCAAGGGRGGLCHAAAGAQRGRVVA